MKKSQTFPIMWIFVLVIAALIIVFGAYLVKKSSDSLRESEMQNLLLTFSSAVERHGKLPKGSVEKISLAVPSGTEEVCFVDRKAEYDRFVRNELNSYAEIYSDANLFFKTNKKYRGEEVKSFATEKNPLCIKAVSESVSFEIIAEGGNARISGAGSESKVDCTSVLISGNTEDKIDIVFLPFGYKNVGDFRKDVAESISQFKVLEPVASNIGKINFYAVDDSQNLDCKITSFIECNNQQIIESSLRCPNDYVIVLADRNAVADLFSPVRSSAVANIEKVNTADRETVILHEFGHIFANLADEYTYSSFPGFNVNEIPNCDGEGCNKWADVSGTGCYEGCTLGNYYRATPDSIMRNLNVRAFGPVNEKEFLKRLGKYKDKNE